MMGEFIIYYRGKIVGGIYDDRLLVKPTKSAISYMPTVTYEVPYENAKEMLLVEEVDNKDFLTELFDVMYDELPTPKPKKKIVDSLLFLFSPLLPAQAVVANTTAKALNKPFISFIYYLSFCFLCCKDRGYKGSKK